jgi:hypothetical protein
VKLEIFCPPPRNIEIKDDSTEFQVAVDFDVDGDIPETSLQFITLT